jgi:hypothetical protein
VESSRQTLPNLDIEPTFALHYTLPRYFWFARTPAGAALAKRVEQGMREMIEDGSYDTLFVQYHRPLLVRLDIAHRRFIELKNPGLSPATPVADKRLWVTPAQLIAMVDNNPDHPDVSKHAQRQH